MKDNSLKARFHDKYVPEPNSGCWLWTAAATNDGYGNIWHQKRLYLAHRISWFIHFNEMPPDDIMVCHKCDVPSCVNPNHLFIGTATDNMLDMGKKKRTYFQKYPERCNLTNRFKDKTHCIHGHLYTKETVRIGEDGGRRCKICEGIRDRKRKEVRRQQRLLEK